jgi:hypothetical protein
LEVKMSIEGLSRLKVWVRANIAYLKESKQGSKEPGANHTTHEEAVAYAVEPDADSLILEDTAR